MRSPRICAAVPLSRRRGREKVDARQGLTVFVSLCRATAGVGTGTTCLPPGAARPPWMDEAGIGVPIRMNAGGSSVQAARAVVGEAPSVPAPPALSTQEESVIRGMRSSRAPLVLRRVQDLAAGRPDQPRPNTTPTPRAPGRDGRLARRAARGDRHPTSQADTATSTDTPPSGSAYPRITV
jgi:hypothetical protein